MRDRPAQARFVSGLGLAEAVDALDPHATSAVTAGPWWRAWIDTLPSARGLLVERDGAPVALLPLATPGGLRPWLEPLGASALGEPVGALAADPAALADLAHGLAAKRVPLSLPRIPSDDPLVAALRAAHRPPQLVRVRPTSGAPVIDLRGLSQATDLFGRSSRQTFGKKLRRAEKLAELSYEVHEPAPGEVDALVAEVIAVESRSWKRDSDKALASNATLRAFFHAYARHAARAGVLRIAVMRIGGTPAAVQLSAESHAALNQLRIGYDDQFARVSPGQLLMLHMVDWALGRGLERYEILGKEEAWNRQWKAEPRPLLRVMTFPPGARSLAALGVRLGEAAGYRLRSYRRPSEADSGESSASVT
ncbi:MAG TPA: GNAT family N-acetyltransferase [Thermoleophilaceae bacterium]|nr:GNAT family N-acetyltransferase [Thermoleophilaceae bacterium]